MFDYTKFVENKLVSYVTNAIVANYHYSRSDAEKMVSNSAFMDLLQEEPQYVFHYSVEHWAKEIVNENSLVCV